MTGFHFENLLKGGEARFFFVGEGAMECSGQHTGYMYILAKQFQMPLHPPPAPK